MTPGLIELVQNTDAVVPCQVVDLLTGDPEDITGYTIRLTVKRTEYDPGPPLLVKTTDPGGGIVITAPTTGNLEFRFAAADTMALYGDFFYEVTRTDTGNRERIEAGRFRVLKTITA